jgi:hypothetical protein
MSGAFEEYAEQVKKRAARVLSKVADEAKAAGVPCETLHVTQDRPFESIVAIAKDKGCDLIVMASHGRTGIAAMVLGSVTPRSWHTRPFQCSSADECCFVPRLCQEGRSRISVCCSRHPTENRRSRFPSCNPAAYRPPRIASTMSGASSVSRKARLLLT